MQGIWGALTGFQWSPTAAPLAAALGEALRRRTLALLQCAYSTLTVAQLAGYLGVAESEALRSALLLSLSA